MLCVCVVAAGVTVHRSRRITPTSRFGALYKICVAVCVFVNTAGTLFDDKKWLAGCLLVFITHVQGLGGRKTAIVPVTGHRFLPYPTFAAPERTITPFAFFDVHDNSCFSRVLHI